MRKQTTVRPTLWPDRKTITMRIKQWCFAVGISCTALSLSPAGQAAGVVGTGTAASCTQAALNTALAGGGNVSFNCGAAPVTISLTTAKTVSANTTIDGGNLVTLDGGAATGLFFVNNGVTFTVSNITLQNAWGASGAGAIAGIGTTSQIIVTASRFLNNTTNTGTGGAAIGSSGSITVTNSVFANNIAGCGGAIWGARAVQVTDSTFSGNQATGGCTGYGGAIYGDASVGTPVVTVTNSTFSENFAAGPGGAIAVGGNPGGAATVTNSSFVSAAHSPPGSAVAVGDGATINLANSIMVSTTSLVTACAVRVTGGTINNLGGNIQYNPTGPDASCGSGVPQANPQLGPLADNGGPTRTFALAATSPAVDFVTGACPATDQRGVSRPQGTRCDAGAYELVGGGSPPATIAPVPALDVKMLALLAGLLVLVTIFYRPRSD